MRYSDALQMVDIGFRLLRSGWNCRDRYVYRAGKILTLRCREGLLQTYQPTDEDLKACDWELLT